MTDILSTVVALQPTLANLAPSAVLQGEKRADYEALLARISAALRPADIFEEIWTRDVVDLVWEVFRLRRLKAALMREDAFKGMLEVLSPRHSLVPDYYEIAKRWACGDRASTAMLEQVFATAGVTMDAVHAKTLALRIDEVERIDRMTMVAEGRRDSILREIDRYRVEFSQRLRRTLDEAQDAEFNVIAPEDAADTNGIAYGPNTQGGATIGATA